MDLKKYYKEKLDNALYGSERTKKKILYISTTRLAIFIAGFIALCFCYDQGGTVVGGILLGTLIPFLLLVKLHNRLFHRKDWYETSIRHYKAELASLENDHSAFDGGKEWIDASHPFSLDLDVFGEHSLFLNDVRYFLDYEPKIKDGERMLIAEGGDIEMNNVFFRYEGASDDTLKDISLKIKKGEHIALVGQNGSGKTTLVKLLLRLYDPTYGEVLLNGENIKDYSLSSYREDFSCVFQDFKVFALPVKDNVTLRREREGDRDLVISSLKESGGYDKVMTLEKGIDTTLTREFDDNGANLSIGEQQKISLARVFADDASCVILDEPSSALDPIAEHKMFENMMRAAKGRTVIFISHRLSSAVDADRIYLMEGGTITESGTHHELMQKKGKYLEMFKLQAQNYIGKEEDSDER